MKMTRIDAIKLMTTLVVSEVPEARLSVNDRQLILMKSISILKYTSTYLQQVDKLDCLLKQSSKIICPVSVG